MMKTQYDIYPKQTVLVLGGRGFIGRHVVKHLALLGAKVVVGSRQVGVKQQGGVEVRQVVLHKLKTHEQWAKVLVGIDVVINTVGILRQRRGETYESVHHHAIETLAEACAERNLRLVHVSALGLDNPVKSKFSTSKRRGESVLRNSHANWAIVRPSLVDGEGGYGAKWFQCVAKWPIHFVPANAAGLFAPIDADDLGEAIARIGLVGQQEGEPHKRVYELGGNQQIGVIDYLKLLRPSRMKAPALVLKIPVIFARLFSHFFDLIHVTPYSFGHYEMLQNDNTPVNNRLSEVLGRPATVIVCRSEVSAHEPQLSTCR